MLYWSQVDESQILAMKRTPLKDNASESGSNEHGEPSTDHCSQGTALGKQ